jgi:hypothetical protein
MTKQRKSRGNPYLGISSKQTWVVVMGDGARATVSAGSREEAVRQMEDSYRRFGRTEKAVSATVAATVRR